MGAVVYNYVPTDMSFPDREGVSVFYRDARGAVYHTYSCYARGIDMMNTPTTTWTWCPRAGTRTGWNSPSPGCNTTIDTRTERRRDPRRFLG